MDHGKILANDTVDGLIAAHGGDSTIEAQLAGVVADASAGDGTTHSAVQEHVPAEIVDGRFRYTSGDAVQEVVRLANSGLTFTTLSIQRPDLESVFLNLTGRSLRD